MNDREPFTRLISQYAEDVLLARARSIETTVEAAIQGGEHGVAVVNVDGATASKIDPLVPYGHIFEFPTADAYRRFVYTHNGSEVTDNGWRTP